MGTHLPKRLCFHRAELGKIHGSWAQTVPGNLSILRWTHEENSLTSSVGEV
jgi:hypothetical protein